MELPAFGYCDPQRQHSSRRPLLWTYDGLDYARYGSFGGLHCLARSFEFPTNAERLLWRMSTLTVMVAPILLPLLVNCWTTPLSDIKGLPRRCIIYLLLPFVTSIYVGSRLCLIALAFASLRVMPEGVYQTTWTKYLVSVH